MKSSDILINFIKRTEGCKLTAYQDSVGVWTIGYGHTQGVKCGDRITQQQADDFLRSDLQRFETIAAKTPGVRTQGQFDAVTDFCYNCGPDKFQNSTLRRFITSGRKDWEIQKEFLKWTKAGGKELGGLVSRRVWEAARWKE